MDILLPKEENFTNISQMVFYGKKLVEFILSRTKTSIYKAIPENIDVLMWKDFCFDPTNINNLSINYKIEKLKEYKIKIIDESNDNDNTLLIVLQQEEKIFCSFIAYYINYLESELHIDLLCTKPIDYQDNNITKEKNNPCQSCSSKGYATMLLFMAVFTTMEKNLSKVVLEALPGNQKFYEKIGFYQIGPILTINDPIILQTTNLPKTIDLCIQYLKKIKEKILEIDEIKIKKRKLNNY